MKPTLLLAALVLFSLLALRSASSEEGDPPRLVLSSEGMLLEVAGEPPRRFSSAGEVVRAVPGLRGEFTVETTPEEPGVPPEPAGKKDPKVRIEAGEIPVLELARFLGDATGLPVIHDSNDTALAGRKVTVAAPIDDATGETVKQILALNRIRVREERAEGRLTLRLESMGDEGGLGEPVPRPIVVADDAGEEPERPRAARPRAGRARVARGPGEGRVHLGMTLVPLPDVLEAQLPQGEDRGVLVESVERSPPGGAPGLGVLKRFDVVTHVGVAPVSSPEELVAALESPGEGVELRVLRKGMTRILRAGALAR